MSDYLPVDNQYIPVLFIYIFLRQKNKLWQQPFEHEWFCHDRFLYKYFRILNGSVDKNIFSGFTRFSSNGNSVVDYALV